MNATRNWLFPHGKILPQKPDRRQVSNIEKKKELHYQEHCQRELETSGPERLQWNRGIITHILTEKFNNRNFYQK